MKTWRISNWVKERLMQFGIDAKPFHRTVPRRPTAWIEFNEVRFTPEQRRVELLFDGHPVACLEETPFAMEDRSLTVSGGFVGYASCNVD